MKNETRKNDLLIRYFSFDQILGFRTYPGGYIFVARNLNIEINRHKFQSKEGLLKDKLRVRYVFEFELLILERRARCIRQANCFLFVECHQVISFLGDLSGNCFLTNRLPEASSTNRKQYCVALGGR